MVQPNQATSFKHGDGRAVVGRQAVLHVLVQIQFPETPPVGGCLQEGEHVVPGGAEDELGGDRAVLVGEKATGLQTLVGNGSRANGVFQVEFVFPP